MKVSFFSTIVACLCCLAACKPAAKTTVPTGDNSMTSLDWNGIYYGVLPCADCEGIETLIQLNNDKTYTIKTKYQGKSGDIITSTGSFTWNKEGSKITLDKQQPGIYLVGENKLVHLDKDGKTISGSLAEKYILQKQMPGISEKYWKLTELYGKPVSLAPGMKKEPHMILHTAENKVNVMGGCNNYMGAYDLKPNNQIRFGKLAGTLMACPDMEVEAQFMKALSEADNYSLIDDKLTLNKARMAPLARFEAVYLR
ncbi:copper resistance protein NlpE N-terminal domain-containing protein [Flavihumibacter fluvii]|uniref:copper resistance protein NlpE N-terminal domain-containing protein n=1 Tax=Flavihumibacter fluvii TaxID=2838157 RepID=UPI001BDE5645|nr:copper resistance protein NlpE N-terminal domain-containing protein [Flavihumibacter fluvii]ULQ50864.1 copper resistance protein NlpE N-terminal domain-containing protein [Flavihumibacter fluvii]